MAQWHVLGAGSMGLLWATALAAAGQSVQVRTRPGGLAGRHPVTRIETDGRPSTVLVDFQPADIGGSPIDYLLVTVKAPDTGAAIAGLGDRLRPDCPIVLMQNGMGVAEELATRHTPGVLYAAVTTEGAYRPQGLTVVHAGRGDTMVGDGPQAEAIAQCLNATGHRVTAVNDITQRQWAKLAVNCVINPVTALLDCPNGRIAEPGPAAEAAQALAAEVVLAAKVLGRQDAVGDLWPRVCQVAGATAANRSSMRQDVAAGRRTEIDYLNGYLLAAAAERGLHLPCNRLITDLIHAREPQA